MGREEFQWNPHAPSAKVPCDARDGRNGRKRGPRPSGVRPVPSGLPRHVFGQSQDSFPHGVRRAGCTIRSNETILQLQRKLGLELFPSLFLSEWIWNSPMNGRVR